MDIIIEGVITKEEGMNEVIETIIHLKSVPSALLRVSCKEAGLQGRVGFGPGGYILGGCIDDSETGYAAVKKLLTVKSGNYAVLDMTNEHVPEINQTLWLKGDKILEIWPNLPDSPDSLIGGSLTSIPSLSLQNINRLDPADREEAMDRMRHKHSRSKAHQAQITQYHLALKLSWLLITLVLVMVVVKYGYILVTPFLVIRHPLIK